MVNQPLLKKLNDLEYCLSLLETVRKTLDHHGYAEQVKHTDSLSEDINWLHRDAIEFEGPLVVMKGEK